MSYHAELGRSALKAVDIDTEAPQKSGRPWNSSLLGWEHGWQRRYGRHDS